MEDKILEKEPKKLDMTAAEEKELALIDIGIRLTWDSDGLS